MSANAGNVLYFERLCRSFELLSDVEAIVLGGSRAGDNFDEKSDYDLYIYCRALPDEKERARIIGECCGYSEISNRFWETEDDCTLLDGTDIDIIYRNIDDFAKEISSVVDGFGVRNGYTTCMWHNLLNSRILFDRNGEYGRLKSKYEVPYPKKLKENIIRRNMRLLSGNLPSYDKQILKAARRGDYVSVNHRVAAYLESYFDIIVLLRHYICDERDDPSGREKNG